MLTSRFNQLWDVLVDRFTRYEDLERDPKGVVELATLRAQLDDVRTEIAEERAAINAWAPRGLNRPDRRHRRHTEPGVPVLLFDADLDDVTVNILHKVHSGN